MAAFGAWTLTNAWMGMVAGGAMVTAGLAARFVPPPGFVVRYRQRRAAVRELRRVTRLLLQVQELERRLPEVTDPARQVVLMADLAAGYRQLVDYSAQ